jgi:hypothetical protein
LSVAHTAYGNAHSLLALPSILSNFSTSDVNGIINAGRGTLSYLTDLTTELKTITHTSSDGKVFPTKSLSSSFETMKAVINMSGSEPEKLSSLAWPEQLKKDADDAV